MPDAAERALFLENVDCCRAELTAFACARHGAGQYPRGLGLSPFRRRDGKEGTLLDPFSSFVSTAALIWKPRGRFAELALASEGGGLP